MSLLGMLLMLCIGAKAADVTATWDFANNCASLPAKSEGGAYTETKMASDNADIEMTIVYNGGQIKNNDNSYQVRNGVEIRVPVNRVGDLVVVVGYIDYSYYTIGGGAEITNTSTTPQTEYKAKAADVAQGYVSIVSTNNNNYINSISVTQYEEKEPTTLVDQPAIANFAFTQGTSGQKATFDNADYWIGSKVEVGSNMGILDSRTISDVTFTRIQPKTASASAAATDYVLFRIQPKFGFTFTPTSVALKAYKDGTGNGKLTLKWVTSDGTETEIASNVDIQRNNATPPYSTLSYESISGVTPVEGYCGLKVYIGGNLSTGKQVGLSDIVINGTLSGTEKEVPVLGSFTLNGTEYSAEEVFEDQYEATLKLSKKESMVGDANPLSATAMSGEVGEIVYSGDDTQCTVTIPMTAGEVNLSYTLNVIQKPDYTLTYYGVDGTVMDTQVLEEDQTIGEFKVDIANVSSTIDGYKARGWFKNNYVGEKHQTTDVVTSDLSLYAVQTEIGYPSESKKYEFDLRDKNFDANDNEAFNPTGGTPNVSDMRHGWAFSAGNTIDLLVGSKASIILTLCQYSKDAATINATIGSKAVSIPAKTETDGATQAIEYEGEPGTLTLTINGGTAYIHKLTILNTAETNYDKDGQWIKVKTADASSLLAAIDAANGTPGDDRIFIYLPNGTYDLAQTTLTTIGRSNVSVIGESMEGTIIKNRPVKEGIAITATILNTGSNNYFQDLTLDCIAAYGTGDDTKDAERGVCLQDKGDQTICKNVYLKGLQDSYYSNNNSGTYYFEDSKIEGTVDYVCGNGDVYFNKTNFMTVNKSHSTGACCVAAPNTPKSFGYIFSDCVFDAVSEQVDKYRLGRPWADNGTIIRIINATMNAAPVSTGWDDWGTHTVVQFGEYNSVDANGNPIDVSGRKTTIGGAANKPDITAEEAPNYAVSAIFNGDWKPNEKAAQVAAPTATLKDGVITITPANGGNAGVYLIEKNGEFLKLTSETEVVVEENQPESFGNDVTELAPVYTVRASNAMGGFGEAAIAEDPTAVEIVEAAPEAKVAEGAFVIGDKVVIIKDGKQFTAAGARIK